MKSIELRQAVGRREIREVTLPTAGSHGLALALQLTRTLPIDTRDRLHLESWQATSTPIPGTLGILRVELATQSITVLLEPIAEDCIRLDVLLSALDLRGSPLGALASAWVMDRLASTLAILHEDRDSFGTPRVHACVRPSSIFLGTDGSVHLIGPGLPMLNALLVHSPARDLDFFRFLSPEASRGEPLDRRDDVYALGALYYELLSGSPYRGQLALEELYQATIENHPPDLPARLPDPRPELLQLLRSALEPDRNRRLDSAEKLGAAVRGFMAQAALRTDPRQHLARILREFVAEDATRGPWLLIANDASTGTPPSSQVIGGPHPDAPVIPVARPTFATQDLTPDLWSAVLGDGLLTKTETHRATFEPPSAADTEVSSSPFAVAQRSKNANGALSAPPRSSALGSLTPTPLSRKRKASSRRILLPIAMVTILAAGAFIIIGTKRGPNEPQHAPAPARTAPGPAPAALKRPALKTVRTPRPTKQVEKPLGFLSVVSTPSGANIEVDGGYVGTTPLVLRSMFDKPSYRITIVAPGFKPWERNISVDPEKGSLSVVAYLERE